MSERMIELKRAQGGLAPISTMNYNGSAPVQQTSSTSAPVAASVAASSVSAAVSTSTATSNITQNQNTTSTSTTSTERVYPITNARNGKNISVYQNAPASAIAAAAAASAAANKAAKSAATATTNTTITTAATTSTTAATATTTTNSTSTQQQQQNQQQQEPPKAIDPSTIMLSEDEKMHRFLSLLSDKKNSILPGPTVPHSLSRRILNRQGVNYMDESISTVMSGAADRFLATVLQQSMICRDRRLMGEEMARKEKKALIRMKKRRREEIKVKRRKRLAVEKELETAIKTPASNGANEKGKKNTTKKITASAVSSKLIEDVEKVLKDEQGNDSVDEEMDYYDNYVKKDGNSGAAEVNNQNEDGDDQSIDDDDLSDEDEDEDDDDDTRLTLQLRDIVRPLEAWGVSLTGKVGLSAPPKNDEVKKKQDETAPDDDSNAHVDGDLDVDGDDDDDDEISISGALSTGPSKPKGDDKEKRKRAATPKGSNMKSPLKAKQRKGSPTPQTGVNSLNVTGRATTPSGGAKSS
jgi:hypothetical protein